MQVKIINNSQFDLPKYETDGAAGMDLRCDFTRLGKHLIGDPIGVGNECSVYNTDEFGFPEEIYMPPHARILIKTGLFIQLPEGYEAQIRPRSGLALKYGLTVLNSPGTIDSDYTGEIGVILINTSNNNVYIKHGERICQCVLSHVPKIEWAQVESLQDTQRGCQGFGHTGKN